MTSFLRRIRSGTNLDPARDWLIVLGVSAMALAGIIVWNIWAFDTVARGGAIGTLVAEEPPLFSGASLDTIRAIVADRAAERSKYITGEYSYADPSQ